MEDSTYVTLMKWNRRCTFLSIIVIVLSIIFWKENVNWIVFGPALILFFLTVVIQTLPLKGKSSFAAWLLPLSTLVFILCISGLLVGEAYGIKLESPFMNVIFGIGFLSIPTALYALYLNMGDSNLAGHKKGTLVYAVYRDEFIAAAHSKNLTIIKSAIAKGYTLEVFAKGPTSIGNLELLSSAMSRTPISTIKFSETANLPKLTIVAIDENAVVLDDVQSQLGTDVCDKIREYIKEHQLGFHDVHIYSEGSMFLMELPYLLNKKDWLDYINFSEFLIELAVKK